jgi:hypothetical protein
MIVDVVVLPTTLVPVTLVRKIEETVVVDWSVVVDSANVTWKVTGKEGIWKLQLYPVCEPQEIPLVK